MKKHHEKCAGATTAVKSHTSSDPSTTKRSHLPSPQPAKRCAISASVTSQPKIDVVKTSNFGVIHRATVNVTMFVTQDCLIVMLETCFVMFHFSIVL